MVLLDDYSVLVSWWLLVSGTLVVAGIVFALLIAGFIVVCFVLARGCCFGFMVVSL